jgi:small subunit ribosomal protein S2
MAENETTTTASATMAEPKVNNALIDRMFKAGAHFAYAKRRRHPSNQALIFGAKNKVEIFDLEKTSEYLERAKAFVKTIAANNGMILFVGGKAPARDAVRLSAASIGMPFVAGRWIGGTFTNFPQIKKRLERLESLMSQREKGELSKYTKKERLLIDREIDKLNTFFSGILSMKEFPKAVFAVDAKREHIAVAEAHKVKVPVIAISGSDSNLADIEFPIPANTSATASISFILSEIVSAYKEGREEAK